MARRRELEERWASYVIEAAQAWGHPGQSIYDRKRHVVTFPGLGEVPLDDPHGRIVNYIEEEQRNEMARRCHHLLEPHFEVPPEWVTGDADFDRVIRRELIGLRKYPTSARPQAGVARIGRQLGIDGWGERWRWSADRFVANGTTNRFPGAVAIGALMWLEIGETDRARAAADVIMRGCDPAADEVDLDRLRDTELTDYVLAVWWRDGRAALASTVQRRPGLGGNALVEAFALAAVAAESGLVDELREQVERLEQMRRSWERQNGPHAFHDGHEHRHVAGVARSWLAELDPAAAEPEAVEPTAPAVQVSAPTPATRVTDLEWRGDTLVADGRSGTVAVDLDGRPALPPPPSADSRAADRLRRVDDSVVLDRSDGTSVTLRAEWDEDLLQSFEGLEVIWSPTGDRLAVWGESGPISVFTPDGSPAGQFLDHWKNPTYGVELGEGRMMSWARDGRAVVYDLDRRLVVGAVQMNGWPEGAEMDASGRIVLTFDNVDSWLAHHIDSGERVGPTRPAVRATLHPTRPVVGYADDQQVWTETYEP